MATAVAGVDPSTVIFDSGDALGFVADNMRVTLSYGANGRIAAAHCESIRRNY
jgi:hypothetical protein